MRPADHGHATMQALQYTRHGPPAVLEMATLPLPVPGPGQVRVRMQAAGVAQFDAKLRAGVLQRHFTVPLPKVPGRDGAGCIDAVGAAVPGWRPGDPVCAIAAPLGPGTCAQFLVCDAGRVVARPDCLDLYQAAALLQPALSAWASVAAADLHAGMRVLVQGGSGAVGALVVQHARRLGAEVHATCAHAHLAHTLAQGAHRVYAHDRPDDRPPGAMDRVFDFVGGAVHAASCAALRPGGRLVYLVAAPFDDVSSAHGIELVRAMPRDDAEALQAVARAAAEGWYRPLVSQVLPWTEAAQAHARVEQDRVHRGRIVLDIG